VCVVAGLVCSCYGRRLRSQDGRKSAQSVHRRGRGSALQGGAPLLSRLPRGRLPLLSGDPRGPERQAPRLSVRPAALAQRRHQRVRCLGPGASAVHERGSRRNRVQVSHGDLAMQALTMMAAAILGIALTLGGCTETQQTTMKGGMVGSVGGLAIGAVGGNAALGMSVGRAAGMGAGYIYSKSKEAAD